MISNKELEKLLDIYYPNSKTDLEFDSNFQLLIAVVLSAQTTDKAVNHVTKTLFSKYKTPEELAKANLKDVEEIIKPIGLYKTKAKNIIELSKKLIINFNSKIPNTRKELLTLNGVGRKTANVVLAQAFSKEVIAVDTHLNRISKRLGIARESDSFLEVELKLEKFFNYKNLRKRHNQIIHFGREYCISRKPKCEICFLKNECLFHRNQKNLK